MPIYELKCRDCDEIFEHFVITSEDKDRELNKEVECPKCQSVNCERSLGKSVSFILKGKGWAKDGYS